MKHLFITCTAAFLLLNAFAPGKKKTPKLPDSFVYVPAGTYYDADRAKKTEAETVASAKTIVWKIDSSAIISIGIFYISKYEVTNLQYRQFYAEVSAGLTNEEKEKIACDTLGWRQELTYNEPLVEYYYRHPAYNDYPAVNIPYEGALQYCNWLQQKIQTDNPAFEIEVKLPGKIQWIYAAQGGRSNAMYPWGNYFLRNRKGEFLCNFTHLGDESIVRNRQTGKAEVTYGRTFSSHFGSLSTTPVKSFYPNDYGLYNVCGNAAEMIADKGIAMGGSWKDYGGDVHIKAETQYEGPAPTLGFRPLIIVKEKKLK